MSTEDSRVRVLWVDTNIIIYFLRNNKEFTPHISQLVKDAEDGKVILKVSPLVIAECVFVLMGKRFSAKKPAIKAALTSFINLKGVQTEEKAVIEEALDNFTMKGIDFVDAYLAAHAKSVQPAHIITENVKDFIKLGVVAEPVREKKKE